MLTKSDEELDYTVDSLTWDSSLEAKRKTVQVGVEAWARWGVGAVGTGRLWGLGKEFQVTQDVVDPQRNRGEDLP